jgi:hypothetical protein
MVLMLLPLIINMHVDRQYRREHLGKLNVQQQR